MAKTPRNRAAQDTTLINLRAIKARLATLERTIDRLTSEQESQAKRIAELLDATPRPSEDPRT